MVGIDRRRLGSVLAVAALVFAGCADAPPPEFVSKGDKFKVLFGAAPQISERTVGGMRSVAYTVEAPGGERSVTITELPVKGDEPPGFASWALESAKSDLIRAARGKEESSASHVLAGKYPGREFSARVSQGIPGKMRARIWLVGARLYQVMVIGTDSYTDSDDAAAFLDSFQLTE
ncbi:MAG TPA: hypothetical protein VGE74_18670 [Gemmata sp.]